LQPLPFLLSWQDLQYASVFSFKGGKGKGKDAFQQEQEDMPEAPVRLNIELVTSLSTK
jgi:hypothetical protein